MVGLLFPGQGSQFVGMGEDLAARFPEARAVFEEADAVLGFALSRVAWQGPEEELTATHNAQPALLTHSIAVYRVVRERLGDIACAAGHSLGEFTAYVAAGALSFADALRVVRRRGELMYESGTVRPGAMAAVLGADEAAVEALCARASGPDGECVPANYNSPGQVVISGDVAAIERAMELAREVGAKRAVRLSVSGAFHSPLMATAEAGLATRLSEVEFGDPLFPVAANVDGELVKDGATAREKLIRQLTAPVRWTDCVRTMRAAGVDRFVELGPGQVLTGLLRRIERDVEGQAVGTAAEAEGVLAA